jgi:dTDP-4-dehydrorhamnose reductase
LGPLVVIGANGQLGTDLIPALGALDRDVVALKRTDFDVRNHEQAARVLEAVKPDVIINTSAFHKVEACEEDPEQAFAVNAIAVRNLAIVAERIGASLVQLSTDYVYGGSKGTPYDEESVPDPVNVYGASKAAGEFFVRSICSRHLIVRTSGLYGTAGSSGKGGNFVQTMLRLGRERGTVSVVDDQELSPTFTGDLAGMIGRLVQGQAQSLFHVTSGGSCSWYEFAQGIFEAAGMTVEVIPIKTSSTGAKVCRPSYSVLSNRRLELEGFGQMRSWREALAAYLGSSNSIQRQATVSLG